MTASIFTHQRERLSRIIPARLTARVRRVVGLVVEASGLAVPVGSVCSISARLTGTDVPAEVVGFRQDATLLMPLGEMQGVGPGDLVRLESVEQRVGVGDGLLGRVLDGMGRPMDGRGPLFVSRSAPVYGAAPDPVRRPRIEEVLPTGIRAIDAFLTIGRGQRIGIFSGTGVGKSVLLGMMARYSAADVSVVALVGERGREVREFIERDLGPEGLRRSVVIVATSDQPAPVRVRAPFVATAIAEHFRDQGRDVALFMDSVTRLAMAQRDIGGSIGEVAAAKGYTPSVFALLPRLMERSGRTPTGSITGFYSVLVEADDMNEPISDAVRGILDGHIVLARRLAVRGHYPAVDIAESISRLQTEILPPEDLEASRRLREMAAVYAENEAFINIGAYAPGANPEIDRARAVTGPLNEFLRQGIQERAAWDETRGRLRELARQSHQEPSGTARTAGGTGQRPAAPRSGGQGGAAPRAGFPPAGAGRQGGVR